MRTAPESRIRYNPGMRGLLKWFLPVAVITSLVACGLPTPTPEPTATPTPTLPPTAPCIVTSSGGSATLVIPEGAVPPDVDPDSVSVALLTGRDLVQDDGTTALAGFELLPDGTRRQPLMAPAVNPWMNRRCMMMNKMIIGSEPMDRAAKT